VIVERFWIEGFLQQADLPSNLNHSLAYLAKWACGATSPPRIRSARESRENAILPEDLLEAHLSLAVRHAEGGKTREAEQALRSAEETCKEKPLFESQLRLLQVRVRIAGKAEEPDKKLARRLLARCHGGIHGTRLSCQLALVSIGRKGTRWLNDARERLSVLQAKSPDWAWEAICKFPEVKEVLGPGADRPLPSF
jgi:hypothetical protein